MHKLNNFTSKYSLDEYYPNKYLTEDGLLLGFSAVRSNSVYQCFRYIYCLHHQAGDGLGDGGSRYLRNADFHQTTTRYSPELVHPHTRCSENLESCRSHYLTRVKHRAVAEPQDCVIGSVIRMRACVKILLPW